ncbi:MAG: AMP-binding protein, partial [Gemmatimonadetes bacterium]|nr:long-chain fatty acid--CoA ligase [Gemmatimonadota bacterium]NIR78222.1 long-chain fatty acid--CoA ligase [Gemmatimonadota bacterium]NIT86800.1 long-chain fatty acid--CoA ligase [Gemmatimonadota bacterium]NIU30670.1 long-chain fatty acid--CoA ligase [Gemmatimonadota bacterium]NIU35470.1 AMP-binding protein [Gemmatimonadota bacterium]
MTDRDDPVRRAARHRPEAPALEWEESRWSWAELDRRVDEAAGRLRRLGVEPGNRAALVLETGPGAVTLIHAASRAGAVPVALSPRLTSRELGDALGALAPALLLCDLERAEACRAAGDRVGVPVRSIDDAATPKGAPLEAAEPTPGPDAWPASDRVRAVVWTSGTSGRPRGVLLTEANFAASAAGARERLDLGRDDRWHASLSLAHVGGLALVDRAARLGCALVAEGPFDPERFLAVADAGRVSHASLVPVMLRRVLDARGGEAAPEGLRSVLVGGARAPASLVEEALAGGWPVALT